MCPILSFTVGSQIFHIQSYTLFAVLGALAGMITALLLLKREGLPFPPALRMLALMAAAFLFGARIFNFAVNPAAYGSTLHIYSLKLAGLSLYGGVLGALASFLVWVRLHRRSPLPLLDALVLPSAAAFASARVGCYLNGCCSGKATHSFCGVVFPLSDSAKKFTGILSLLGKNSVAVYPTQLFEMSLALIGLVPVMWLYFRKKPRAGTVFFLYGIWFTAMRLAILPLRNLPYPEYVTAVWLPVLYGGLIVAGLLLLAYMSGNNIRSIMKRKGKDLTPDHGGELR